MVLRGLRRRYNEGSLQAKFALQIVVSVLLIFAVLVPLVLVVQRQAILSAVEEGGVRLATVFAEHSVVAVRDDSYVEMQYLVNVVSRNRNVLYAMLVGEAGEVLAHTETNERGKTYRDSVSTLAQQTQAPLVQRSWTSAGVPVYDFAVPVYVLERKRAVARVGLSIAPELANIARTRNYIILLGLGVLGAGLMWATYLARRVTRPIQVLVRGTEEIARGSLDHRISIEGGDELGQLARAFNHMTESVQALIKTSLDLSSTLDSDALLRSIANHALGLVKADMAFIAPLTAEGSEARVAVVLGGRTDRLRELVVTPGRGVGGQALATAAPIRTANYLEDPRFVHDPLYDEMARAEGIAAELAVPITLKGEVVGLLWVANRIAGGFTQEDEDALRRMASQAAIAMQNTQLYEELRRSHENLVNAQEELVRKTRLAVMGELAAGVAHELRNPLGALANCVSLLRASTSLTPADIEVLDIVQAECQRLNELGTDFLTFGRPRPLHVQVTDLHELIDESLALLRRDDRCPPGISFVRRFDAALPKIEGDRDHLHQAFWNLFLNAVQAMGMGGELRIETRLANGQADIFVQDTGPGIPPAALPRIFEPFFTTKSGGTGLGLSIVRRIVEEHRGQIAVKCRDGEGTCFTVSLPLERKDG